MNHPAIQTAVEYLKRRGATVPPDLLKRLSGDFGVPLSSADKYAIAEANKAAIKQAGTYQASRSELWAGIYDAVYVFLTSNSQVGTYSRPLATAVSKAPAIFLMRDPLPWTTSSWDSASKKFSEKAYQMLQVS